MDNLTNDYTYLCSAVMHPLPSLAFKPSTVKLAPRYMAKRPLLTIKIPTDIEQEPSKQEVSCFSPMTPDVEDSESEATEGADGSTREERDHEENEDEARQQDEQKDNVRPMVRFGALWGYHRRHGSFQANASQARRISQWHRRLSVVSVTPVSHFSFSPSSYCSSPSSTVGDCTVCGPTPNSSDTFHRRRLSLHGSRPSINAGGCLACRKTPHLPDNLHRRRALNPFDGTPHRRVPSTLDSMSSHRSPQTFSFPSHPRVSKTSDRHGWRMTTC